MKIREDYVGICTAGNGNEIHGLKTTDEGPAKVICCRSTNILEIDNSAGYRKFGIEEMVGQITCKRCRSMIGLRPPDKEIKMRRIKNGKIVPSRKEITGESTIIESTKQKEAIRDVAVVIMVLRDRFEKIADPKAKELLCKITDDAVEAMATWVAVIPRRFDTTKVVIGKKKEEEERITAGWDMKHGHA